MQNNSPDNIEFEAKFYPVDKEQMRQDLESIGAELTVPERLMRRQHFNRETNEGMEWDYVRVRDEGSGVVTMSGKIHAKAGGDISDQKEVEVIVSSYDDAINILLGAGLTLGHAVENLRETWTLPDAEVVIDTWPSLEPYIEIEAVSEERVKEVAEKLGLDWNNKIITTVISIYAKEFGLTEEEAHERTVRATFNNPPF